MLKLLLFSLILLINKTPAIAERPRIFSPVQSYTIDGCTVNVYAYGGAPSYWIKGFVQDSVTSGGLVDIWIVEGGINDALLSVCRTTQGLQMFAASCRSIRALAARTSTTLFFQEIQPVLNSAESSNYHPECGPVISQLAKLNNWLTTWTMTTHTNLIPVSKMLNADTCYQPDSVHLTDQGNSMLANAIWSGTRRGRRQP